MLPLKWSIDITLASFYGLLIIYMVINNTSIVFLLALILPLALGSVSAVAVEARASCFGLAPDHLFQA